MLILLDCQSISLPSLVSSQADRSDLDTKADAEEIGIVLSTMRAITSDLHSNISDTHDIHNASINILADGEAFFPTMLKETSISPSLRLFHTLRNRHGGVTAD